MLTHFSVNARVGFLAALCVIFAAARGDAANLPIYTAGTNNGADGTVGPSGFDGSIGGAFVFTGSGQEITALGFWDYGQNGLSDSHTIGLWTSDGVAAPTIANGTLLASANIPAGTGGTLVGEFRYVNLSTPVVLTPGASYVLGANMNGNDAYYYAGSGYTGYATGFGTFGNVGYDTLLYSGGGSSEPTTDYNYGSEGTFPPGSGFAYFGPNALFAPVPEPSSIVLAMIGSMAAVWFCKKRRSA